MLGFRRKGIAPRSMFQQLSEGFGTLVGSSFASVGISAFGMFRAPDWLFALEKQGLGFMG